MEEYKYLIKWIAIVLIAVIVCGAGCQSYGNYLFVKGGYTSGTVPGNANIVWIKK